MNNKIKSITLIILITFSLTGIEKVNSQDNNGMYFLRMAPQANYMNPAIRPECNWYLGAPVLSSAYFEFNSAVSFNDILFYDPDLDSVVTFLSSKANQDNFIKRLDKAKNLFGIESHFSIGSFGFKVDKLYFNADMVFKTIADMNLPADFVQLFLKGNYNPATDSYYNYDLSKLDINATAYIETSLGVSYELNDQITLGARPKLIFGLGNVSSADEDIHINTNDSTINLSANFNLNTHIPGMITQDLDDDGLVDTFDIDNDRITSDLLGNVGFGLDLGATYKFDDKINLYASIVDLGWISWKKNPRNMAIASKYDFKGIEFDAERLKKDEGESNSGSDSISILDTLKEYSDITSKSKAYRTGLATKIYLGGTYSVHDKIDVGVLSRSQIYRGRFSQQLTLSAIFEPFKFFNATVSYTMKNNTYNNLGYGLSYKFGPFNSYVVIDKTLALSSYDKLVLKSEKASASLFSFDNVYPIPHKFRRYTIRFGANLMFGCGGGKKKKVDEPIIN